MQLPLLIQLLLLLLQVPIEKYKVGDKFPACAFVNGAAGTIHTDSLVGDVLVIDFWASWNLPSRKYNLQLIKLYEKYRQQNFRKKHQIQFISVSLDTRNDLWLVARAKDNLHWPINSCDFKGWESEFTDKLGLELIPANYIVDPKGVIVAKNLWGPQLDSTLKTLSKEMPN